MKTLTIVSCYLLGSLYANAQVLHYSPVLTAAGSGAYSQGFVQTFSFLDNQAALCRLPKASVAVHSARPFGLKELSTYLFAGALPLHAAGVGLALQHSGFSAFSESRVSLAYGRDLGGTCLGVQFNYHRLQLAGYGNDAAIGFEISSLLPLTSKLTAGARVANPAGGYFQNSKQEKLASVYQASLAYDASEQVHLSAQWIKEEGRPVNVLTALYYTIIANRFFTRVGIASGTGSFHFATGYQWRNCRIDVCTQYHPQLGFTPSLVLIFYAKQKEAK